MFTIVSGWIKKEEKASIWITAHFQEHLNLLFVLAVKCLNLCKLTCSLTLTGLLCFSFPVSLYRIKTIFSFVFVGLSFYAWYKTDSGNNKNINHTKAPSSWGIYFLERLCSWYIICVSLKYCRHQVWIHNTISIPRISPVGTQSIAKNALVQTLICFSAISWNAWFFLLTPMLRVPSCLIFLMSIKLKNTSCILQLNFVHATNTQINILFSIKKKREKLKIIFLKCHCEV